MLREGERYVKCSSVDFSVFSHCFKLLFSIPVSGIIAKLSCLVTAVGLCKEWLVRSLYDLLRPQLAASRATGMCSLLGLVARDEKDPKLAQKQINALTLNKAS